MTTPLGPRTNHPLLVASVLAALALMPGSSRAGSPEVRVMRQVVDSDRVVLQGTRPLLARPDREAGRLSPETVLESVTIAFGMTAAQEADLKELLAAQQDPASPLYQKWLTPEKYAARFGVVDSDIAKVKSWLAGQGLKVESVSRSKNSIRFTGTVGQIEAAFRTELHYYQHDDKTDFAPSTEVSVPAAIAPIVSSVRGLTSARPRPHFQQGDVKATARPLFTSGITGGHFLGPADVKTIYDIAPAYSAGLTGEGQTIVVVGQSTIVLADLENFQSAADLPVKDPGLVPVLPGSSSAAAPVDGDESESDLDLEWSNAIAPGATIKFVYANGSNQSVWNALEYAVDQDLGFIISMSYGTCEASLSFSDYNTINAVLAQAASQGQSVVVASGDSGSTDCYGTTTLPLSSRQALGVDFPSSSQYVTGIGGTEFPLADVIASKDAQGVPQPTTYFQANGTTDVLGSAISYIPEQVWNDDVSATTPTGSAVQAGGGGVSALTPRPAWQAKVPGIPSGSKRLVPDVSLTSSAANAPYLYCSSDASLGITGSCANGFRDSTSNGYLTVGGGTSFATPVFAGMLALIGEKIGAKGLGVAAATLYSLAANSTTYAAAFHDITSGGNNCTSGVAVCGTGSAVTSYAAGTGYDLATGLGSVDFNNLLAAWPSSGSTLVASTTTLTAATTSPASGESDTITISVASASTSSTAIPTGTVSLLVDGGLVDPALPLSNGSATYTFSSTTQGTHSISSAYSGDSTYATSDGALTVVVGEKGFGIALANTTVASGGSGSTTVTVTPVAGYTGTVAFSFASVPGFSNGCLSISDVVVSGTSPVTGTLNIKTSSALCNGSALSGGTAASTGRGALGRFLGGGSFPLSGTGPVRGLLAVVSLLFAFAIGLSRQRRRLPLLAAMACAVVLAASACGGGSSGGSSSNTGKGTYAVTITGKDTIAPSIAASTVIIVTID